MTPSRRTWPAGVIGEHGVVHRFADGTHLHADVYRPAHAGPLPALFMRLPYDRVVAELDTGVAHPSWFAAQGYVVVVQDVRGTGSSTGDFEPFRNEAADGVESLNWVAGLDGADGRVMTYGSSYMGLAQLLVAAERPAALQGVAPAFAASGVYDGWITESGAVNVAFMATWTLNMAVAQAKRQGDQAACNLFGDVLDGLSEQPDRLASIFGELVDHPAMQRLAPWASGWWHNRRLPDWWSNWSIQQRYGDIEVPGWHAAGLHDLFAHGTVENFLGLQSMAATQWSRDSQRLVLGPWSHDPSAATVAGAGASVNRLDELWLEWAGDVLNRRMPVSSPVTVWTEQRGWRGFDSWPPSDAVQRSWHLRSDGRAQSRQGDGCLIEGPVEHGNPADVLLDLPDRPVASLGGRGLGLGIWMGEHDQRAREDLRTVLVYSTTPSDTHMTLVGDAVAEIFIELGAAPAQLIARLSRVTPDGSSVNLQDGVAIVDRHNVTQHVRITIGPLASAIMPGERLRLTLAATDVPRWEPSRTTPSAHQVLHDAVHPSRLTVTTIRD